MKRPIRFLCAIIVLSLLCGAFCGGAAALRLERSGDSVIVTREEGDPEFLFVAEYDENGRMTSVRAVGDSVTVSEAEAAKLFRMESGAEPADESIDLLDKFVTAETVGFSAENCPVIEDRTFAEPLRVLHTGGDGGFIRFVNCNFEQGIGVASEGGASFLVDFTDSCTGDVTVMGTDTLASRIETGGRIIFEGMNGLGINIKRRADLWARGESVELKVNGVTFASGDSGEIGLSTEWFPNRFDEYGAVTACDEFSIVMKGSWDENRSQTLSGSLTETLCVAGNVDITALTVGENAHVKWMGDMWTRVRAADQRIEIQEFTDSQDFAADFTGAGTVAVMGNRWTRVEINGERIDQAWLNRWDEHDGFRYNVTFGSEAFAAEGEKSFELWNGDERLGGIETDFHDGWTTLNGDGISENTSLVLKLPGGVRVEYPYIARDWTRIVGLSEFARWIVERLVDWNKLTWEELTESEELLSSFWTEENGYYWVEKDVEVGEDHHLERRFPWGSPEDRLSLTFLLSAEGFSLDAENYPDPGSPVSYLTAKNALSALAGAPVELERELDDGVILIREDADELIDIFRRRMPKETVEGSVTFILNDERRYSTDGGQTWSDRDFIGDKVFNGAVRVEYGGGSEGFIIFENCDFTAGVTICALSDARVDVGFNSTCTGFVECLREHDEPGDEYDGISINGADGMSVTIRTRGNVSCSGGALTINGVTADASGAWLNANVNWWEYWENDVITGRELVMDLIGEGYWYDEETGESSDNLGSAIVLTGEATNTLRFSGVIDASALTVGEGGKLMLGGDYGSYVTLGANDVYLDGGISDRCGDMYIETTGRVISDRGYAWTVVNGYRLRAVIIDNSGEWVNIELGASDVAAEDITLNGEPLTLADAELYELFFEDGGRRLRLHKDLIDWNDGFIRLEIAAGGGSAVFEPVAFSWDKALTLSDLADRFIWDFFGDEYDYSYRGYEPDTKDMRLNFRALNFLIDYAGFAERRVEDGSWTFWNMDRESASYGDMKAAFTGIYRMLWNDENAELPESVSIRDDFGEWDENWTVFEWTYSSMLHLFNLTRPRETVEGAREYRFSESGGGLYLESLHFTDAVELFCEEQFDEPYSVFGGTAVFINCEFDSGVTLNALRDCHYNALFDGCVFNDCGVAVTGQNGNVGVYAGNSESLGISAEPGFGGTVFVCGNADISAVRCGAEQIYDEGWDFCRESSITVGNATLRVPDNVRGRQYYTADMGSEIVFTGGNLGVEPVINGNAVSVDGRNGSISYRSEGGTLTPVFLCYGDNRMVEFETEGPDEYGWSSLHGEFWSLGDLRISFLTENDALITYEPVPDANNRSVGIMEFMHNLAGTVEDYGGSLTLPGAFDAVYAAFPDNDFGVFDDDMALLAYAVERGGIAEREYFDPYDNIRCGTARRILAAVMEELRGAELPDYVRVGYWPDADETEGWSMSGYDRDELLDRFAKVISGRAVASEQELTAATSVWGDITVISDFEINGAVTIPAGRELHIPDGVTLTVAEGGSLVLADGELTVDEESPTFDCGEVRFSIFYAADGILSVQRALVSLNNEGTLIVNGALEAGTYSDIWNFGSMTVNGTLTLADGEQLIRGYLEGGGFVPSDWDEERGNDGWIDFSTRAGILNRGELEVNGSLAAGIDSRITNDAYFNYDENGRHPESGHFRVNEGGTLVSRGRVENNSAEDWFDGEPEYSSAFFALDGEAEIWGFMYNGGEMILAGDLAVMEDARLENGGSIAAGPGTLTVMGMAVNRSRWIESGTIAVEPDGLFTDEVRLGGGVEFGETAVLTLGTDPEGYDENGRFIALMEQDENDGFALDLYGAVEGIDFALYVYDGTGFANADGAYAVIVDSAGVAPAPGSYSFENISVLPGGELIVGAGVSVTASYVISNEGALRLYGGAVACGELRGSPIEGGAAVDSFEALFNALRVYSEVELAAPAAVTGDLCVPEGCELTILPGAGLTVSDGARLIVEGRVCVLGELNVAEGGELLVRPGGWITKGAEASVTNAGIADLLVMEDENGFVDRSMEEFITGEVSVFVYAATGDGVFAADGAFFCGLDGFADLYSDALSPRELTVERLTVGKDSVLRIGGGTAVSVTDRLKNSGEIWLERDTQLTFASGDCGVIRYLVRVTDMASLASAASAPDTAEILVGDALSVTEDFTVPEGMNLVVYGTLTVQEGVTLTVNGGFLNFGAVDNRGTIIYDGDFVNYGAYTGSPIFRLTYRRGSDAEIYEAALGEFAALMEEARAESDYDTRLAKYAAAEAALLDSAVMIPTTAQGGGYALSRIAPHTAPHVQWGSDDDRVDRLVISDSVLTREERDELTALWRSGSYDPAAYLLDRGHTLRTDHTVPVEMLPETLDWLSTGRGSDLAVLVNLCDGLVRYDNMGRLTPALAESWTVSQDGLTYTFRIRDGVKWMTSEGGEYADLTARDFENGWRHMVGSDGGLEWLTDGVVAGVSAPDDSTLVITLERETPYFMSMLTYSCFLPYCESFAAERAGFGVPSDAANQVYCGAFILKSVSGGEFVLEKNPAYYDAASVTLDTVTFELLGGDSAYDGFVSGRYDAVGLSASDGSIDRAVTDGLFAACAYTPENGSTTFFGTLNLNRGSFDADGAAASPKTEREKIDTSAALGNRSFRKALLCAFDRTAWNAASRGQELASANLRNMLCHPEFAALSGEVTLGGHTFAAGTWYCDMVSAFLADRGVAADLRDGTDGWYDPDAARDCLEAAKAELSITLPVRIDVVYYGSGAKERALKESVEGVLGAENVTVNLIEAEDMDAYYASFYFIDRGADCNYDFFTGSGWGPDYGDPSSYLNIFLGYGEGYMTSLLGLF